MCLHTEVYQKVILIRILFHRDSSTSWQTGLLQYRGIAAVDEQPQMLNYPFNRGCAKLSSHLRVFGRHGDMLFLFPSGSPSSSGDVMDTTGPHSSSSLSSPSAAASTSSSSSSSIPRSLSAPQVQEDEIDQYLAKQDGKIYRNKDPQL